MRTGRPKQPLTLTAEERERLESLAHRARTLPLLARRARIVLACADGLDNKTVARRLRASLGMVGKWRARGPALPAPLAMPKSNTSWCKLWKARRVAQRTGAPAV